MSDAIPPAKANESGVGQWLREQREARAISLEAAAQVTRISKSQLDALEREEFDRLPSRAYCIGFLRIYSEYLGLSGDEAILRAGWGAASSAFDQAEGRRKREEKPVRPRFSFDRSRLAMPLALLVLVLVLAALIDTDDRPPLRRPPANTAAPAASPAVPVQEPRSSSRAQSAKLPTAPEGQSKEAPQSPPSRTETETTAAREGLILSLKVNQDSWLNIEIDGRFSQQYELKAGDLIEWKAATVITLDLGNAGGVEAVLNGKPLPAFGASGKNAHVVLRPDVISGR